MVIAQLFGTECLEPNEGGWLWRTLGVIPDNTYHRPLGEAVGAGGMCIVENIEPGNEFGEWAEAHKGEPSRELLSRPGFSEISRRCTAQFCPAAYDIKLADSLWTRVSDDRETQKTASASSLARPRGGVLTAVFAA